MNEDKELWSNPWGTDHTEDVIQSTGQPDDDQAHINEMALAELDVPLYEWRNWEGDGKLVEPWSDPFGDTPDSICRTIRLEARDHMERYFLRTPDALPAHCCRVYSGDGVDLIFADWFFNPPTVQVCTGGYSLMSLTAYLDLLSKEASRG